jgi:hypothetical protein
VLRFLCDEGYPDGTLTRREWLRVGPLAGLTAVTAARAAQSAGTGARVGLSGYRHAKSVLLVFTGGGVSQLDTWDPKPDAPLEIRGEFRAISTSVPGTHICEHLPQLARLADRYALIRSMSHDDVDHGSACYLALTGQFHSRKSSNPPPSASDFPTYGAIVKRVRPTDLFPYSAAHHSAAHLNAPLLTPREAGAGQFGGLLGRAHEPLVVGDVSHAAHTFLGSLVPQSDLPSIRLQARRSLLEAINGQIHSWQSDRALLERNLLYRQAFEFLDTPRYREAFDLSWFFHPTSSRRMRARCFHCRAPWPTTSPKRCSSARTPSDRGSRRYQD